MTDGLTLEVYRERAHDYAARLSLHRPRGLDSFIAAIPTGGRVLDVGCGPGRHAALMAEAGLAVLAIDATPEMVAMAAISPGVTARLASFDDVPSLGGGFDGIWAHFSLLHAPRADVPRHLADLHAACRPGARLHLGMKLGAGEGRDRLGRFYSYFGEQELADLVVGAGFGVTGCRTGRGTGLSGEEWDWIALSASA